MGVTCEYKEDMSTAVKLNENGFVGTVFTLLCKKLLGYFCLILAFLFCWWEVISTRSGYPHFLTRELRACARASCRYDVKNGTRSVARSISISGF